MLSHRDFILNRPLSQLNPQWNHLEYHIDSTLYTEENDTPITWAHSTTGGRLNSHTKENDAPSHGHAQHWALSQDDSTQSQRRMYHGECLTTLQSSTICIAEVRHYLLGKHFKMFTDHSSLKYLVNKPVLGGRICIFLLLFHEFYFELIVKPWKLNA